MAELIGRGLANKMKPRSKHYEIVACLACGREFERRKKDSVGIKRLTSGTKSKNAKNCSPHCARIWRNKPKKEKYGEIKKT